MVLHCNFLWLIFYTHISRSILFCAALVHFHFCMIFRMLSHRTLYWSVLSCLLSVDIWMISSFLLVQTTRVWTFLYLSSDTHVHELLPRVYSQKWSCCWQMCIIFSTLLENSTQRNWSFVLCVCVCVCVCVCYNSWKP